jgi:hypothetical protein
MGSRESPVPGRYFSARLVKIFMRHTCNTSSIRQGACGNALESGPSAVDLPSGEQKNVTLPLMVPLAMKVIDEFHQ